MGDTKIEAKQSFAGRSTKTGLAVVLLIGLVVPILVHSHIAEAVGNPTYRYTRAFNSDSGSSFSNGIATDSGNDVYTTGSWNGTVTFDGTGGSDTKTSSHDSVYLTKRKVDGSYVWTKTFDVSAVNSSASPSGVAVDGSGNIYVAGSWNGTVVFDGPGGSHSATTTGSQNSFLTKYNADGSYAWTKTFSVTGSNTAATAGVAVDSGGNIYVAGQWQGTVTFDGPGGSDTKTSTNSNGFLTKYNPDGSYAYTRMLDTSASGATANTLGLAVDGTGNVYVTGAAVGTVVFDGPGGSHSQATGTGSVYVIKYSPAGNFDFATYTLNGSGGGVWPTGIAVDRIGHVYVSGEWNGTEMFNGPANSDSQTSPTEDAFLMSINTDGSYNFTKVFDATGGSANGYSVATDAANDVYLTGIWSGTVIFDGPGGSAAMAIPTNPGNLSVFVTQFNSSGNYQWTKLLDGSQGSIDNNPANGITVDSLGNLYVSGEFFGPVNFAYGSGSDIQTSSSAVDTAFLTSFGKVMPIATNTAAKVAAPDTGYGRPENSNRMLVLSVLSLCSIGIGVALPLFRRLIK